MKMFRNLSVLALTFFSMLLFSFYGCQKEENQITNNITVSQNATSELTMVVEERDASGVSYYRATYWPTKNYMSAQPKE
jgi:hypothetical protein